MHTDPVGPSRLAGSGSDRDRDDGTGARAGGWPSVTRCESVREFFRLFLAPAIVVTWATAWTSTRDGVLPRLFGWISAAYAALLTVALIPVFPAGLMAMTFFFWLLLVSLRLWPCCPTPKVNLARDTRRGCGWSISPEDDMALGPPKLAREVAGLCQALDLHRNRVDLRGGVTRPLVNSLDCVRVWRLREAPHHARVRIPPCSLEVDALLALNVEISLMSRL